jgi:hypothetical protein
MKTLKHFIKLSFLAILMCISTHSIAQTPQGFNYQAVVRNAGGAILPKQQVNFRISLLHGSISGTNTYTETHLVTTDQNGLVNFVIGTGAVVNGIFKDIQWGNGPFFVKVEIDPTGGSSFVVMSTTQLLSVPYALFAEQSRNVNVFTYTKAFSGNSFNTTIDQGKSWTGVYNLNYICGEREKISFSETGLPLGMSVVHKNSSNQLDFSDSVIIQTSEAISPGNHAITLIATSESGTKAKQSLSFNVQELFNFSGSILHYDSVKTSPNYNAGGIRIGPFTSVISPVVSNQFTISKFGQDSVTITANLIGRTHNEVAFNIPTQTHLGCTYAGNTNESIYKNEFGTSYWIYYTRTCGNVVQYCMWTWPW